MIENGKKLIYVLYQNHQPALISLQIKKKAASEESVSDAARKKILYY